MMLVLANYMIIIFLTVAISIRLSNPADFYSESDNSDMARTFGSAEFNFA